MMPKPAIRYNRQVYDALPSSTTHRGSPDVAGCSAYPSIAVISISLPDRREGPMHKTRHCVAFRVYASPRSRSITVSGIPGAHCLRLWRALAESNDRNLSRLLSREASALELVDVKFDVTVRKPRRQ